MLEEDTAIDYSQNQETVESEYINGRDVEDPGTAGEPNGGHYLDPENPPIYNTDDLYSQSSPLLSVSGDSSMNTTEYQDWTAQHGVTVASLLDNCYTQGSNVCLHWHGLVLIHAVMLFQVRLHQTQSQPPIKTFHNVK